MNSNDVLHFWFEESTPEQWFTRDENFDRKIKQRFSTVLQKARDCELFSWRETAQGRLAEVIVLDQFSRNIYRDQPQSLAQDPLALALAQEAIARGLDQELTLKQRPFLYLPFMHSESLLIHEKAVQLYSQPGLDFQLDYELKHLAILKKFGRYPHRNSILGRTSTNEELEFLKSPDSSF